MFGLDCAAIRYRPHSYNRARERRENFENLLHHFCRVCRILGCASLPVQSLPDAYIHIQYQRVVDFIRRNQKWSYSFAAIKIFAARRSGQRLEIRSLHIADSTVVKNNITCDAVPLPCNKGQLRLDIQVGRVRRPMNRIPIAN